MQNWLKLNIAIFIQNGRTKVRHAASHIFSKLASLTMQ